MLAEVIDMFLVDGPQLTGAIRQATAQGDGQRIRHPLPTPSRGRPGCSVSTAPMKPRVD